jgi:hypothetical protein
MPRKKANNEVADEVKELLSEETLSDPMLATKINEVMKQQEELVANEIKERYNLDNETENDIEEMETKNEEEPKHFEIIEKIKNIEKYFNEVDEYFDNISSYQSQNDEYISDLLHYMEVHDFTQASALKFINLLKEKRLRRRTLNNDYEIKRVFDSGRNRFAMYNSREMFMASLYKKERELSHPYNPRQVEFEEIDQLISVKRGRKAKEEIGV